MEINIWLASNSIVTTSTEGTSSAVGCGTPKGAIKFASMSLATARLGHHSTTTACWRQKYERRITLVLPFDSGGAGGRKGRGKGQKAAFDDEFSLEEQYTCFCVFS